MYVDPGGNLLNAFRSQQDNRFRHKQLETDKALRERGLNLQEDEWNTRKGWQQDEFDRDQRKRSFDSELASNYYNELEEQQAYDQADEDWNQMQYGSYAKLGEGKGLGNVMYDQAQQRLAPTFRDIWSFFGVGDGRMTYEDIHPEGVQMPERSRKALFELQKSEEFTPEQIERIKEMHKKSPSTKGLTQKSLIDLLTEFRESY